MNLEVRRRESGLMNGLVSVIIPNFNYGAFVEKAVVSVLEQDYEKIEIIVVDDGSTDNSIEVLRKFGDRIRLIESSNMGAPTARNIGILASRGSYIAFLDSDDFWYESKITRQIDVMLRTNTELNFCHMEFTDNKQLIEYQQEIEQSYDYREFFINNPGVTPFIPSCTIMTRSLLAKTGLWDTALQSPAEDFDLFRRCARHTLFSKTQETLVVHREHENSLTATNSIEKYFLDNKLAMLKAYVDDLPRYSFFKRRISFIKLHIMFTKAYIIRKSFLKGILTLLRSFFPVMF